MSTDNPAAVEEAPAVALPIAAAVPVSTQEANPWKAVSRTVLAVLSMFPIVNAVLVAVGEWATENQAALPGWLFAVINGALLVSAVVAGLITKLLAIPAVNEWLRRGAFRSLLAPDNEPSLVAKKEVDVAAGPPPATL